MKDLLVKSTIKTPKINLRSNGVIEIKGSSFIENTRKFYIPVVAWLNEYVKNPSDTTFVNLEFEYYNTSSQMWIFKIIQILSVITNTDKKIEFNWYFQEEEVREAGEDIENLLNIKMNFIKV